MKLKGRILLVSLLPLVLLGTILLLVSADRIANGIYDEAYVGMNATTLAARDIFETGNEGMYRMDENGELWKGDSLNISQATDIVDNIKENTGMDVTVFWGDTRILTSIVDAAGKRQVGTQASEKVSRQVLVEGKPFYDRNVDILGTEYIVYYTPFYREGSSEVVGMVFLGTPQKTVSAIINKVRLQMLLIILTVLIWVGISTYSIINNIMRTLKRSMGLLAELTEGNLKLKVDEATLKRKDEIGDVGRSIAKLGGYLRETVLAIMERSDKLSEESHRMEEVADNAEHAMKEVEDSAQQMAASTASQAEDEISVLLSNLNQNSSQTVKRMEAVLVVLEEQEKDISCMSEAFRGVTSGIDETVSGMNDIMEKAGKLETVRTDTVAVVQNSAALAEENSASIEEVLALVETVYKSLGDIARDAKGLNQLSEEMKESVHVFTV